MLEGRKLGYALLFARIAVQLQWALLGADSVLLRRTYAFVPESRGKVDIRARLVDIASEFTESDNTSLATIRVIRQRLRVLLRSPRTTVVERGLTTAGWGDRSATAGDVSETQVTKATGLRDSGSWMSPSLCTDFRRVRPAGAVPPD